MHKYLWGLCWELGIIFLLDPTLDASPKLHFQRMLSCRYSCHTWDLWLESPCEVVSPNFHALNSSDCIDWPQVTWNLGLGALCEMALKVILVALTYTRPSHFEEFARTKTIHSTPNHISKTLLPILSPTSIPSNNPFTPTYRQSLNLKTSTLDTHYSWKHWLCCVYLGLVGSKNIYTSHI